VNHIPTMCDTALPKHFDSILFYLEQGCQTQTKYTEFITWTNPRTNIDIYWKNLPPHEVSVTDVTSQTLQGSVLIDAPKHQKNISVFGVLVVHVQYNSSGQALIFIWYHSAGQI